MKHKWTQYLVWLALLLPIVNLAQIPQRPDPPRLVNDFANILSQSEEYILEDSLVQFAGKTSNQIVVVTVSSLEGYDPAEFAYRIGQSWGVGQKEKNNGIVVLVKPKTAQESGKVYISVGYGLEGVIPDAIANGKIIDNEMIPLFKQNDYFGGIMKGVQVIMRLSRGEYTADQYDQHAQGGEGLPMAGIVFIIFFIIVIIAIFKGGGNTKSFNTGSKSLPFWILLSMMNSRGGGGSWSDFSGGRGGFGGGGGGGFGGFGGGGFGGGGAGGSW